jgi:fructokinase
MVRIGIDFGGTKIEAAALDSSGNFIARIRAPNPGEYVPALVTVRNLVQEVERRVGSAGSVGVGHPGSLSPVSGKVRNANNVMLNDQLLREHLEAMLERPIRLANDANCLAISEAADGAGAGERTVFGVIIGTGCGGGIVIDGKPVDGRNGVAGEWGHTPLPWPTADEVPGPLCWCRRMGCMETYVSGTGFEADYTRMSGKTAAGPAIVQLARQGDLEAENALNRYANRLARGLAVVCDVIDPDVIILGGGMSNVTELYDWLPEMIGGHVFTDTFTTPIRPAKWGDSSGVRGAAWLWEPAEAPQAVQ